MLVLLYAVLFLFFKKWWSNAPLFEVKEFTPVTRLSVIVPARNEERNIHACITSVLQQSYPSELLEIIIIDDHSTDQTAAIVQSFQSPRIQLIQLTDNDPAAIKSPKKFAIQKGIEKATGQLIITTDADCAADPNWLTTIESYYRQSGKIFIAAPVKINSYSNVLSKFQSLDFLTMQGITAAVVDKQFLNMCNGANLAYERSAFFEVSGFTGIDNIASGDDMLLMNKMVNKYPGRAGFLKSADAIVTTEPALSWSDFFQQRIRWASKATNYQERKIFTVLLLVYCTNLLLLGFGIASIIYFHFFPYYLAILMVKFLAELFFVIDISRFFRQQRLLIYLLILQPLHILYIIVSGLFGQFKSYRWKGRTLK